MSYSVFYYSGNEYYVNLCGSIPEFTGEHPSIHAQHLYTHIHTHTHTHAHTHTRTHTHAPQSLSLLPGRDPETAVCLHTSKGEWLSIGMTSTQEIIGTSKTSPTAPFPPSLHSLYFSQSFIGEQSESSRICLNAAFFLH